MILSRVTGPECPRCGCQDSKDISRHLSPDHTHSRQMCRHCDKTFRAPIDPEPEPSRPPVRDPGITFQVLRCPKCGSDQTRVTKTVRPVRYHKCKICSANFKSVEK